jgi:5'-nucleotidase
MVHTPGHDTDLEVIEDGYIAVTPLQLDLTHSESLANLRSAYSG